MMIGLSYEDAVRDSPKFYNYIQEQTINIHNLEAKLELLLKLSTSMIESGKTYLNSQRAFCNCLTELASSQFSSDEFVYSAFGNCSNGLITLVQLQSTLIDQLNRTMIGRLTDFVKNEIRSCKESRSTFDKSQTEYNAVLVRNSSLPKQASTSSSSSSSSPQIQQDLTSTKINFRQAAFDLTNKISTLQKRKRYELLEINLVALNSYKIYFRSGFEYFKNSDTWIKALVSNCDEMRQNVLHDIKSAFDLRPSIISSTIDYVVGNSSTSPGIAMQGYLFRKTPSKTFKSSWKRRWFELLDSGSLICRKRNDLNAITVLEEDLRICLVRPMALNDCDRRFTFELISPTKNHILQADSEDIFGAWVTALQSSITVALHNSTSRRSMNTNQYQQSSSQLANKSTYLHNTDSTLEKSIVIQSILNVEGNDVCADCSASNPEWASINLGIILCIECSGIHRSLGVSYSKVKSLKLDSWETGLVNVMLQLGNSRVNSVYLAKADILCDMMDIHRATPTCSREQRETWIRAKYIDRIFVINPVDTNKTLAAETDKVSECSSSSSSNLEYNNTDINTILFDASKRGNLKDMCEALAGGADINWINHKEDSSTALHAAVSSGSVSACEFLLLNGAKINATDKFKQSPLLLATKAGNTEQICLFLRNKADHRLPDLQGNSPLDVAVKSESADTVTLLRLARMEQEMLNEADETFQEIVREIAKKAHDESSSKQMTMTAAASGSSVNNIDEELKQSDLEDKNTDDDSSSVNS